MTHHHDHHVSDSQSIRVAFFLNLGFTIVEIIGGLLTNSVAILSDAVHDLGDTLSLGMAWFLGSYSEKESNQKYTYGYRRYALLSALINSVVLVGGSLFILSEAIPRLLNPESFNAQGMIFIAVIGVLVNGLAVFRLRGRQSMNVQVVSWHLLEDVLGWVAVLFVGVVSLFVDAPILDPILSILVTVYILSNAINNLRRTLRLFLQASPTDIDMEAIERELQQIDGVKSTHHTHLWSLDGEHHVFTSHLVTEDQITAADSQRLKREAHDVVGHLELEHITLELEFGAEDCSMQAD